MAEETIKYTINVEGNATAEIAGVYKAIENLNVSFTATIRAFNKWDQAAANIKKVASGIQGLSSVLQDAYKPGIALNSSLASLSASSGITGSRLKQVESCARQTAKTFGGTAAQSVEAYTLLLSRLSPELAKSPEAMQAMGNSIAVLGKTMGGDTTAAAEILTTAMTQYGVSVQDPIAASLKMSEMMNVMAAAAKEGSAGLPRISEALSQCGTISKDAGVSFSETNAAIQVLDKAGKKGAEGGMALCNVMTVLSNSSFLPEDVQGQLQAAGINISALSDKSKSLADRLQPMRAVMQDSALFTKVFGRENSDAAMALVQGTDEIGRFNSAITGTNTAYDQAGTVMDSYSERQSRIKAKFDDIKISIFNATGGLGLWIQMIADATTPITQLAAVIKDLGPLFGGLKGKAGMVFDYLKKEAAPAFTALKENAATAFRALKSGAVSAFSNLSSKLNGFVAVFRGGIGKLLTKLSVLKLSALSAGGFLKLMGQMGASACRAIGVAIMNIPIIGWIAAGVAALIALFVLLWEKCEGFRIICFVIWEAIKSAFAGIGDFFVSVWEKIKYLASFVAKPFIAIWKWIKGLFSGVFDWLAGIIDSFLGWLRDVLPKGIIERGVAAGKESWAADHKGEGITEPELPEGFDGMDSGAPVAAKQGVSDAVTGGTRSSQVTINLGKLVENIIFNGGLSENKQNMTAQVEEALVRVLYAAQTAG